MIHKKKIFIYAAFVLASTLASGAVVRAQSEEVKAARTKVGESIEELSKLKTSDALKPNDEADAKKQLETKRNAVKSVIDLTLAELKNAREKLDGRDDLNESFEVVRTHFVDILQPLEEKADDFSDALSKFTSKIEIESFAKEFGVWRTDLYNPAFSTVVVVNAFFAGLDGLKVANVRFLKVSAYVEKVSAWHLHADELKALVARANKDLEGARKILQRISVVYVGIADATSTVAWEQESLPKGEDIAVAVRKLRDAYAVFLKIAKLAAKE